MVRETIGNSDVSEAIEVCTPDILHGWYRPYISLVGSIPRVMLNRRLAEMNSNAICAYIDGLTGNLTRVHRFGIMSKYGKTYYVGSGLHHENEYNKQLLNVYEHYLEMLLDEIRNSGFPGLMHYVIIDGTHDRIFQYWRSTLKSDNPVNNRYKDNLRSVLNAPYHTFWMTRLEAIKLIKFTLCHMSMYEDMMNPLTVTRQKLSEKVHFAMLLRRANFPNTLNINTAETVFDSLGLSHNGHVLAIRNDHLRRYSMDNCMRKIDIARRYNLYKRGVDNIVVGTFCFDGRNYTYWATQD